MSGPPEKPDRSPVGDERTQTRDGSSADPLATTYEATPSSPEAPTGDLAELPVVPPEHYAVAGEFARGGLGRVLAARDRRLGRPVAIKELIRGGRDARFLREAALTARLQHPSIVPVYEAGRWPSGEPFYAMKMVSGRPLSELIQARRALNDRLALLPHVIAIADAVAYAHGQHVIHRDLKPSNALIGEFGETVVIDWGLAKDLAHPSEDPVSDEDTPAAPGLTVVGSVLGTPSYMPPEQARGEAVDQRADVYAIGAILYHLLAGAPPYRGDSSERILARVLAEPPPPLDQIAEGVPRDLLAIVRKAMARSAAERYPSAQPLALDLKRFQTGQLVSAREYSPWLLFRRWLLRHRALVATSLAFVTALAVVGGISLRSVLRSRRRAEQRRVDAEAARAREQAESARLRLMQARAALDVDPSAALAWLRTVPTAAWGDEAARIAIEADSRGVARYVRHFAGDLRGLDLAPDGTRVAVGDQGGLVTLIDLGSGQARTLGRHDGGVVALAFSPDGGRVVSSSRDESLRVWDLATGQGVVIARYSGAGGQRGSHAPSLLAWSPDGKLVASADRDGGVRLWPAAGGGRARLLSGHRDWVSHVVWTRDGKRLVSGAEDGEVRLWDVAAGTSVLLGKHDEMVEWVALAPDQSAVASVAGDRLVRVWSLTGGAPLALAGHEDWINRVDYSADGRRLVSTSGDGTAREWDARTGAAIRVLRGHRGVVLGLALGADGSIVTSGLDHSIRLWDAAGRAHILAGHAAGVRRIVLAAGGSLLVSGDLDGELRVWRLPAAPRVLTGHGGIISHLTWAAGGVMSSSHDGTVRLWPDDGPPRVVARHPVWALAAALSPDGIRVVSTGNDYQVRVTALSDGRVLAAHPGGAEPLEWRGEWIALMQDSAALLWNPTSGAERALGPRIGTLFQLVQAPDGVTVLGMEKSGTLRLWDGGGERQLPGVGLFEPSFAPDSRVIAGPPPAGQAGFALWDVAGGAPRGLGAGAPGGFVRAQYFPDGARVAASGEAGVWVYDTASGAGRRCLADHEPFDVVVGPGGRRIFARSSDGVVALWDPDSCAGRVLAGHDGAVTWVEPSPDGARLASGGADATVRVWPLDAALVPVEPAALAAWLADATDRAAPW